MKSIKALILVFAAMLISVSVMAEEPTKLFPIETTFNIGTGATYNTAPAQDVQAVVSVGFETVGEFTWVAGDLGITTVNGGISDVAYTLETKVGFVYGKLRPYTSLGYVKANLSDLGNVDFKTETATYGIGVRYDLSKSTFLDFAYKTLDGASESYTAKVHYKFN